MSSDKADKAALEVVARQLAAAVHHGRRKSAACLTTGGKRIAIELVTPAFREGAGPIRLRFDRVAVALVDRVRAALQGLLPRDRTVVITCTAPIRLAAKTAATLEETTRSLIGSRTAAVQTALVHGNQVQVAILRGSPAGAGRVVGFVHNPGCDPAVFLELIQPLLDSPRRRQVRSMGTARERWLVLADERGVVPLDAYRSVCRQLHLARGFARILLVLPGGRIETLTAGAPRRLSGSARAI